MADVIAYNGQDKWKQKATELLNQGGGGGGGNVDDVKVNGTSVVDENKVAQIDLSDYATQSYVTNALDDYTTTAVLQANYYNKTEVNSRLADKADASTTYTKTEVDTALSSKANANSVYTKTETDDILDAKQDTLTAGTGINIDANNVISATGGSGTITDVQVDGVSVVSNNVANITNKVSRTGDTMTGDLAIEKNTPQVTEMDTLTTLDTSTNNGVTSNRITASLILKDSNDNFLGRLLNEARTDGSVRTYLQAFNMKTNGDLAYNTFWLGVTKSGENVYYIASPSAFRSAIGIEPTSTTTGTNGGTVRRWGNIVSINFQGTTGSNIGSVPVGYRPQSTAERTIVYVEKYNGSTITNRYYALLAVESNGNISCSYASSYGGTSFASAKDANHKIYGNITYIIADND